MIGVTGSNGFVGKALCEVLEKNSISVTRFVRKTGRDASGSQAVGEIGPTTDWGAHLTGLRCVVHCAAHVHQMGAVGDASLSEYRRVNAAGTVRLAESAAAAGVQRLIFISSVKVMGESTVDQHAFDFTAAPAPLDAYGASKWAAEQGLWRVAAQTGLEIVVIRPPLIYGPGVGANFRQLMRWVAKGWPLPLAGIDNRRSLVSLANLVDLIALCIDHPKAPGHTFMVSDGHDLSTPELIRHIAKAMSRPPRLFPAPASWLRLAARLAARLPQLERLTQNLQVNIEHTRTTLGWAPRQRVEDAMQETVTDFLRS